MMAIYKTYQEAVLENGSANGVYQNLQTKWFSSDTLIPGNWIECNPAYYLETLESFLASGKRLVSGDRYVEDDGEVMLVSRHGSDDSVTEDSANSPMKDDDKRFVLQAAADQVETPEEKEAFDSIPNQTTIDSMNSEAEKESYNSASEAFDAIDTTPQQVESLGKADWQYGDECVINRKAHSGEVLSDIGTYYAETDTHYWLHGIGGNDKIDTTGNIYSKKSYWIEKPETPEQREEREREELAKQIMTDLCGEDVFDKRGWNYHKKFTEAANQAFKLVDLGYRKR